MHYVRPRCLSFRGGSWLLLSFCDVFYGFSLFFVCFFCLSCLFVFSVVHTEEEATNHLKEMSADTFVLIRSSERWCRVSAHLDVISMPDIQGLKTPQYSLLGFLGFASSPKIGKRQATSLQMGLRGFNNFVLFIHSDYFWF